VSTFESIYGGEPDARGEAPGRVNLLGEHTDYNEGFVLPTSIPQRTRASVRRREGTTFRVHSADLAADAHFTVDEPPGESFARYVFGCVAVVAASGVNVPALDIHVRSEVPIGVGLSSSAALEIAILRALRSALELPMDDVDLARLAHRAENDYAGVKCGILDQMACSLLEGGAMLFLDTRTFARRLLPLPRGSEVLVLDSGVSRSLAATGYNERRAQCEQAATRLGLAALRDAPDVSVAERLPEPLRRRARHVITENLRTLQAAKGVDAREFGALMTDSHRSLRDDYEVSIPALDDLVDALVAEPGVYGAKLTGAGFGGACVALCREGAATDAARNVLDRYNRHGRAARMLVPPL
jgi:galactokinase